MLFAFSLLNAACLPGIINQCSYTLSDEFVLRTNDLDECSLVNGVQVTLLHPQAKGMAPSASLNAMDSSQMFLYGCSDTGLFPQYVHEGVGAIDFYDSIPGYTWWRMNDTADYAVFSWEILPDRWYRMDRLLEGGAPIMTLFFKKTREGVVTETYVRSSNY